MPSLTQSVTKPRTDALSEVHRSAQRSAPALVIVESVTTITNQTAGSGFTADDAIHLVRPGGGRFETYGRGCAQ
jgi:hypothetical protein